MSTLAPPRRVAVPVDDATRRTFLAGSIGLGTALLTGCGDDDDGGPAAPTSRVLTDGAGRRVRVPTDPQRVVMLDFGPSTAALVDLGLAPVGATTNPIARKGFSPLLGAAAETIEDVGALDAISIEKIATLRPDLIVVNTIYVDLDVGQLEPIAPTYTFENPNRYAELLGLQADLIGRRDRAEQLLREFDTQLRGSAARGQLSGRRVALVSLRDDQFALFGPGLGQGLLLSERLGAQLVPDRIEGEPLDDVADGLSLEVLPDLLREAEVVVLMRDFGPADAADELRRVAESRLWQGIPAVERGEVRVIDIQAAVGSFGFAGLRRVVEQLGQPA